MLSCCANTRRTVPNPPSRNIALDGQEAQVFIGNTQVIGDGAVQGLKLELLPRVVADGIDVRVKAQFNRLDQAESKGKRGASVVIDD